MHHTPAEGDIPAEGSLAEDSLEVGILVREDIVPEADIRTAGHHPVEGRHTVPAEEEGRLGEDTALEGEDAVPAVGSIDLARLQGEDTGLAEGTGREGGTVLVVVAGHEEDSPEEGIPEAAHHPAADRGTLDIS